MFNRDFFDFDDGNNEQLFSDSELNSLLNFTYQPSSSDLLFGLLPEDNSMLTANFIAELPPSIEADQDNEFQLSAGSEQSQSQYEIASPILQQSQDKPSVEPNKNTNVNTPTTKWKQRCRIRGKDVTLDALYKRNYVYVDTQQALTMAEKKRCNFGSIGINGKIHVDSKLYVKGREIVWLPKQDSSTNYEVGGSKITLSGFYKRKYVYVDTQEPLTLAEMKRCDISKVGTNGELYVDGREIIWLSPNNKSSRLCEVNGKTMTLNGFYNRNYVYADTQQPLTLAEKQQCDFNNVGANGELYVDDREIVWQPKSNKRKRGLVEDIRYTEFTSNFYKNSHPRLTLFPKDPKPQDCVDLTLQQTMGTSVQNLL